MNEGKVEGDLPMTVAHSAAQEQTGFADEIVVKKEEIPEGWISLGAYPTSGRMNTATVEKGRVILGMEMVVQTPDQMVDFFRQFLGEENVKAVTPVHARSGEPVTSWGVVLVNTDSLTKLSDQKGGSGARKVRRVKK